MAGHRAAAGGHQAGRSLQARVAPAGSVSGMPERPPLSTQAREVMRLALAESGQLGHGYVGDEDVLLGLLAEQASAASSLLREHGLDLASARAELQRLSAAGLMPRSRADDAGALRAVGIDVEAVRQRLVAEFGAQAVGAAVWRASRRPWWRGGGRRRTPLCGPPLFAKRALYLASYQAQSRGAAVVTPEHLLYGVLADLEDPYGAQLGRRGASTWPSSAGPSDRSIRPARCCRPTTSIGTGCDPNLTVPPDAVRVIAHQHHHHHTPRTYHAPHRHPGRGPALLLSASSRSFRIGRRYASYQRNVSREKLSTCLLTDF